MGFDVKITTKISILDLVAPHSCRGCGALGSVLCERCKKYNSESILKICSRCKKSILKCHCQAPVYAAFYREGLMKDLVEEYKYHSVRATASILAEMLSLTIPENFPSESDTHNVSVIPLPTVPKHIRERGFDHTLLIAKELGLIRKWKVEQALLRNKNTVQVGADEKTRKLQATSAYQISEKWLRHQKPKTDGSKTYLLLDDVWTTGASMEAAISVLKKAGATNIASAVILTPR